MVKRGKRRVKLNLPAEVLADELVAASAADAAAARAFLSVPMRAECVANLSHWRDVLVPVQ